MHLLALDGNQSGAGVGRLHLQLDFIAPGKILFAERQLQFGILFQRTRQIGLPRHAVFDAGQFHPLRIADDHGEVARHLSGERVPIASGSDRERLLVLQHFLFARFVFESAVILPGQHRNKLALDLLERQPVNSGLPGLRIDRDEVDTRPAPRLT